MAKLSSSVKSYLALFAFVVALRIILFFVPVEYALPGQEQLVAIPRILVIFAIGYVGLYLAPKAGFAEIYDATVSNQQRFLLPILIGLGFGVISVIFDVLQPLDTDVQIKLPGSLLVYPIGGILEEIVFRLLLTTLLIWLISTVIFKGKWHETVFWWIALAVGFLYTFLQIGQYTTLTGSPVVPLVALRFIVIIGVYFIVAAYLYRKYGFLAAVSMRLADYLIYHIIWGGLFLN
jgi:hypothetical protein